MIEEADQVARIINAAFEVERPFRLRGERTSTEDVQRLMLDGNTFFVAEEDHRTWEPRFRALFLRAYPFTESEHKGRSLLCFIVSVL